jgi:dipicolinate synthase subunit A
VSKIPEGALICAGGTETLPEGRYIEDYAARENFAVGYAALAAEGAAELAMAGTDGALCKSRALVLGYGRLGKILSARLAALGARVTAAARREGDLAMAEAMGCDTVSLSALDMRLGEFDYIFNTVPAPVLNTKRLAEIRCGVFMVELAGEPGGFDVRKAETLGIRAVAAPGLPGKCAPQAAAELMRDAVYAIIEEWKV